MARFKVTVDRPGSPDGKVISINGAGGFPNRESVEVELSAAQEAVLQAHPLATLTAAGAVRAEPEPQPEPEPQAEDEPEAEPEAAEPEDDEEGED